MKTNKEIEKEFDNLFVYTDKDYGSGIIPRRDWRPTFQLPDREIDYIKLFITQTRIADLEEMERMVKEMEKFSSIGAPHCRNCNRTMIKATGMGKIAFSYQCQNCNNYQEESDENTAIYNQAILDILYHIQKVKEEIGK